MKEWKSLDYNGCDALRCAIFKQAIEDYYDIKRGRLEESHKANLREIEKFFLEESERYLIDKKLTGEDIWARLISGELRI